MLDRTPGLFQTALVQTTLLQSALVLTALIASSTAAPASGAGPIYPQHPSLTPDGDFVVFSWAGDLWGVSSQGGAATRLTSHPADELHSAVSHDGDLVAFTSDRDGAQNIYVADLDRVGNALVASAPRRVTVSDAAHNLTAFSADDAELLFSSFQERDIYREERLYAAPLDGSPVRRLTDAYGEHPVASRDGKTIVFARGSNNGARPIYRGPATGEVWTLDTATGAFTRITDDRNDDIEPWPMPDGSVVFISSADGQYNLWRKSPAEPAARPLTAFKPAQGEATIAHGVRDLAVTPDGRTAVFAVWDRLYILDLTRSNAQPRPVDITISGDTDSLDIRRLDLDKDATEAALSPDGKTLAVVARGEIFVRSTSEKHPTRRVTFSEARDHQVAWSADGARLYFVSDRDGPPSIYAATVALSRQDIEPKEPEEEPAEPDADEPAAEESPKAADEAPDRDDTEAKDDEDESKEDDGPTPGERWEQALRFVIEPILVSDHTDQRPLPSPDGEELLFVRGRGDLMLFDLEDNEIITLQEGWDEPEAVWAPDSEHIVFARDDLQFNRDLFLMNVEAADDDPGSDAARPINITRHPDIDTAPRLSSDGKVLYFLSDRDATENWNYDVYAVFLDDSLEDLAEYELDQYFKDAAKAAGERKPIDPVDLAEEVADDEADEEEAGEEEADDDEAESDKAAEEEETDEADDEVMSFDTADAYLRVRRITSIPQGEDNIAITPAGDRVLFTSSPDGEAGLYSVDHRGKERKKISGGAVSSVSTSLTGDKAVYVTSGQAHHAPPAGGEAKPLPVSAPVTVDATAERRFKFREAARVFGMTFYHHTMKGLDWPALSARYEHLAMATRTNQEMNRVLHTLFGEVDGSHTGARGGPGYDAPAPRVGLLAVDVTPLPRGRARGFEVTRVLRDGPADDGEDGLLKGDVITHINGQPLADRQSLVDLSTAMIGTAGRETLITIRRPDDAGSQEKHLLLIPHSAGAEADIRYRDEVERREARVHELSAGRIGYLHIRGMSGPQVRDYERDLYAAAHGREGLIIDVRDNGGGWTTDILLASLTAPAHAYTVPRGADPAEAKFDDYPRDRRLIHPWQRPLSVLMNENSYSNAEIFSHSIKTTGRGRLVGTQTHGAVISTGAHTLIDGSFIRIPFRGWYLPDGTDMELNGAMPDLDVPMLPSHEAAGEDPQLKAAVDDLLGRLDRGEN